MLEPRFDRILIVGNSGSGKSWLSERLSRILRCEAVDLDDVHWEPGVYDVPRGRDSAVAMTRREADKPRWIIEGVYGWLAAEAAPRTTTLVWLDLPVAECVANVERRGPRGGATEASFRALAAWTAAYADRRTSSSLIGHARLLEAFQADRLRFRSRTDMRRWLDGVTREAEL